MNEAKAAQQTAFSPDAFLPQFGKELVVGPRAGLFHGEPATIIERWSRRTVLLCLPLRPLVVAIGRAFKGIEWVPSMLAAAMSIYTIVCLIPGPRSPVDMATVFEKRSLDGLHAKREIIMARSRWYPGFDFDALPVGLTMFDRRVAVSNENDPSTAVLINGRLDSFERVILQCVADGNKDLGARLDKLEDKVERLPTLDSVTALFDKRAFDARQFKITIWVALAPALITAIATLALAGVAIFHH